MLSSDETDSILLLDVAYLVSISSVPVLSRFEGQLVSLIKYWGFNCISTVIVSYSVGTTLISSSYKG